MNKKLLIVFFLCYVSSPAITCTVFTASNDTLVLFGNNEDWRQTEPYVWYVPATQYNYGIVYFGFEVEPGHWHTFGGMNECGLCFDELSTPDLPVTKSINKPWYNGYLSNYVLEKCTTVEEVLEVFDLFNLSFLESIQLIFVDRTGASVIIEGDSIIHKEGSYQVATNFYQSNPLLGGWPCWRYDLTVQMLERSDEISVDLFRNIAKAVHRTGDWSTDYTNVYDVTNGIIYVYVNQNYEQVLKIDLQQELAKGYHRDYLPALDYQPVESEEVKIIDPTFDQGILLVNGVSFETYGEEIWNAYQNRAFWGDAPISFWDCFDVTDNGYPTTLPEPLGSGWITADILSQFSTVIWIGNNYGVDIGCWRVAPIMPYIKAGGNLILMSRFGQDFIDSKMQDYLGITWAEHPYDNITHNCIASYPGLQDIALIGDQTYNAVFDTAFLSEESNLLFVETTTFTEPRALGVWNKPASGGAYRSDGGQFVFISGRPYRYDAAALSQNVEYFLENFFHEPIASGVHELDRELLAKDYNLEQNYPNPFNAQTIIQFTLGQSSSVSLQIYDITGRTIKSLASEYPMAAGSHSITWDGKDEKGIAVSSGIYYYKLEIFNFFETKKMVLLR